MSLSSLSRIAMNVSNNRWKNEYSDKEKIGKGGFATVYRAKNCFDENDYAVKKIKLTIKDNKKDLDKKLDKILNESKFLARVNHQNVLRYYNSWLEVVTKHKAPLKQHLECKEKLSSFLEVLPKLSSYQSLEDIPNPYSSYVTFDRSEENNNASKPDDSLNFTASGIPSLSQNLASEIINKTSMKKLELFDIHDNQSSSTPLDEEVIDSITLYIQTELCTATLGDYLTTRNEELMALKRKSLKDYEKRKKEYFKEALSFAKQLLEGLQEIHLHNIVHRDLKPSNIFLADKTCKIGDFGLIKKNSSAPHGENSISTPNGKCNSSNNTSISSTSSNYGESTRPDSKGEADSSKGSFDLDDDTERSVTGGVGTKIYASPEQWEGNREKFDFRADIYSLGIIYLLLFHPMNTSMEQLQVINASKKGQFPSKLEEDLPEIALIVKKMLAVDPADRPSLETILQHLNLPIEISTELSGTILLNMENSSTWAKKYFKLIQANLYIFDAETDKKAENVYTLSEWSIFLKGEGDQIFEAESAISLEEVKEALRVENLSKIIKNEICITLEHPLRLGCALKGDGPKETVELFEKFSKVSA